MKDDIVSKIVIGTANFGLDYGINNDKGKLTDAEIIEILYLAFINNITYLDTAEAYGDAQKRIGKVLEKHPELKFNIITKFYNHEFNGNFRERVENDINALKVKKLYGYLFHKKNDFDKYYNKLPQLVELKKEGLIKKIGVSLYSNNEIEDVLNKDFQVDIIQIPFNVLDNNNKRGEILSGVKKRGIEIHTRSAFLQGLFFKKELPGNLLALQPYLNSLLQISKEMSLPIEQLALNYCLNQPFIDKVLIGIDSKKQLRENLKVVDKMDSKILNKINAIDVTNTQLLNPTNW